MDFCNLPQCVSQPLQYFLKANFSPEKKNERRSLFQDTRDSGIPQFIENVHVCKFRISARITSSNLNLGQMIKSACLLRSYWKNLRNRRKNIFKERSWSVEFRLLYTKKRDVITSRRKPQTSTQEFQRNLFFSFVVVVGECAR